jgi:NAD+ synthase (glutamine-hydrolysing)
MSAHIALAQINTIVGDIDHNRSLVREYVKKAALQDVDLVAFPEMTLIGYPIEDLALRPALRVRSLEALYGLAEDLQADGNGDIAVIVGYLGEKGGLATNSAAVLRHGQVEATYDKRHLPNYGVFDEKRLFTAGTEHLVVEVAGDRVGIAICEDIWQADGPAEALAGQIDLMVVLNGSPYEITKREQRTRIATRVAHLVGAPVAYVNLVGGQDDLVFDGASFVITPEGDMLAQAYSFEEDLLLWSATEAGRLSVQPEGDEEVYRALVLGLRDYAVKNGFHSVVLGLSGGIDSALVAAISADALGGNNVVGVSMPSAYSSDHSKSDAVDMAERIGADYRVQPIGQMFDAFMNGLPLDGVAEENLQSRLRGLTLMAISNSEGHLVLATGNKSELAVGYSTIYGDAVGGYAPIKDLPKSRVWSLSNWRNEHALAIGEVPPIPENSITKPPSAELRPGQEDTDSLPPYDVLDAVLEFYVEQRMSRDDIVAAGYDVETVDRVLSLVDRAEWKRRQYPPGAKITALSFGRDRRVPITNHSDI